MHVMITGGTGFVGYHTALALMEAGHTVSLLVRSVDKMLKLPLHGGHSDMAFKAGHISRKQAGTRAIQLFPVAQVITGSLGYRLGDAKEVVMVFRDTMASAPDGLQGWTCVKHDQGGESILLVVSDELWHHLVHQMMLSYMYEKDCHANHTEYR